MQITVLKVLAGHPEGRASIAELTRYVAVLMSSGTDWSLRMKALAARAPGLDIFSSGYVLREMGSCSITDLGRTFLTSTKRQCLSRRSSRPRSCSRLLQSSLTVLTTSSTWKITRFGAPDVRREARFAVCDGSAIPPLFVHGTDR